MAKPKVYIHRSGVWYPLFMDAANQARLASFCDVVSIGDRSTPLPPDALAESLAGCEAILSLNGYGAEEISSEMLQRVGSVRLVCIAHFWGWGHFTNVTKDTGIPVIEGSNAGTLAVAEWNVAAALLGTRRLESFNRALKGGSQWGGPREQAGLLSGQLAGLIGLGRIGLYTARYFKALGVDVIAYSASCTPEQAGVAGIRLAPLEEVLTTADILCLNHRVTESTRSLLGAREFGMIKPGALLINAARAGLYDEAVLIRELMRGRFLAYLDVFADEPLPKKHPFRKMENVFITPHIAGNNRQMFRRCAAEAIETLNDFFEGRTPIDRKHAYP